MSADLPGASDIPQVPEGPSRVSFSSTHWLSFFQSCSSQAWSLNFTSEITGIYPLSFTATITPVCQRISPPNRKTPSTRLPVLMSLHLPIRVPHPLAAFLPLPQTQLLPQARRCSELLTPGLWLLFSYGNPMLLYHQNTLPEHSEPTIYQYPGTCLSLQTSQRQRTCLWDPVFVLWNDVRACLERYFAVTDISLC